VTARVLFASIPDRKGSMKYSIFCCVTLLLVSARAQTPPADNIVEAGRFELRLFEAPAGVETYRIVREGESLMMSFEFRYSDRGAQVSLAGKLRMRSITRRRNWR
jgi:hypothetical protein